MYLSDTSPGPEKPGKYLYTPFRHRRSIYTHFSGFGELCIYTYLEKPENYLYTPLLDHSNFSPSWPVCKPQYLDSSSSDLLPSSRSSTASLASSSMYTFYVDVSIKLVSHLFQPFLAPSTLQLFLLASSALHVEVSLYSLLFPIYSHRIQCMQYPFQVDSCMHNIYGYFYALYFCYGYHNQCGLSRLFCSGVVFNI